MGGAARADAAVMDFESAAANSKSWQASKISCQQGMRVICRIRRQFSAFPDTV
jgi:hypothetical protein